LKLYANPALRVPFINVAVGFTASLTFFDATTVLAPLIAWTRYPRAPPSGRPIARFTVVSQIEVTDSDVGAAKSGMIPVIVRGALDNPLAYPTALKLYVERLVSPLIVPTTEDDVAKSVV
jgi:hypothetical protein